MGLKTKGIDFVNILRGKFYAALKAITLLNLSTFQNNL
jgi:hypothetical protein